MNEKILISACLLGYPVRYDGRGKLSGVAAISHWRAQDRLVVICPEMAAGLPSPRPAAEILGGSGADVLTGSARIYERTGDDATEAYLKGATLALETAQEHGCRYAILTDGSPSCGSNFIYDGDFSGTQIAGAGVTAQVLRDNGIQVWTPDTIDGLLAALGENCDVH